MAIIKGLVFEPLTDLECTSLILRSRFSGGTDNEYNPVTLSPMNQPARYFIVCWEPDSIGFSIVECRTIPEQASRLVLYRETYGDINV